MSEQAIDAVTGFHQMPEKAQSFMKNIRTSLITNNIIFPLVGFGIACLFYYFEINRDAMEMRIVSL
jgi:hypothetical protein